MLRWDQMKDMRDSIVLGIGSTNPVSFEWDFRHIFIFSKPAIAHTQKHKKRQKHKKKKHKKKKIQAMQDTKKHKKLS